jgi:hypothetical protein
MEQRRSSLGAAFLRSSTVDWRRRVAGARSGQATMAMAGRTAWSPGRQPVRYLTIVIVRNIPSWKCSRPSSAFIAQAIT